MEKMCRLFKVSASGYYSWQKCPECNRDYENKAIYEALQAIYGKSKGGVGLDKPLPDVREKLPRSIGI